MNENVSEQKKMSRRKFIKTAGIGCGAAALLCVGGGALASLPPAVEFYESPAIIGNGKGKVLVVYASKAGSTAEVAQAIAETLRAKGLTVDVSQVKHAVDLSGYQAVMVGSCIRMGAWLPEAVKFVEKNQAALKSVPTAFFQVGAGLKEDTPANREEALGYMAKASELVEPVSMGVFAGKVDFSKLSLLDRLISNMVGSVEGDWRDWDAIRAWTETAVSL
ncbi:MAG: flavodoxin domain-containing protein [Anaerolineaceae bacterium]